MYIYNIIYIYTYIFPPPAALGFRKALNACPEDYSKLYSLPHIEEEKDNRKQSKVKNVRWLQVSVLEVRTYLP